jgi:hypothetical protein
LRSIERNDTSPADGLRHWSMSVAGMTFFAC